MSNRFRLSLVVLVAVPSLGNAFTFEYYGYASTSASLYTSSRVVATANPGSTCYSHWAAHGGGDWMSYSDRVSSVYPYSFFYEYDLPYTDSTWDGWYVGGTSSVAGYNNLDGTFLVPTVRGFFTGINDHKVLVSSQGDLYNSINGQKIVMGVFTAVEINNSNVVVGYRGTQASPIPVVWKSGVLTDLTLPHGVTSAKALDVRGDGFIIGKTNNGSIISWDSLGNPRVWTETSQVYQLGLADGGAVVFTGRLNGQYGPWLLESGQFVDLRPTIQNYLYSPYDGYGIECIGDGTIDFSAVTYQGDPSSGDIFRKSHAYGRLHAVPEPASFLALLLPALLVIRGRRQRMEQPRALSVLVITSMAGLSAAFTYDAYGMAGEFQSMDSGTQVIATGGPGSYCVNNWAPHGGGSWYQFSDRTTELEPPGTLTDSNIEGWIGGNANGVAAYSTPTATTLVPGIGGWFTGRNDNGVFVSTDGQLFNSLNGQIIDMGEIVGVEVNNSNVVVGFTGDYHHEVPKVWKSGVLSTLSLPPGVSAAMPLEVREDGVIFGVTSNRQIINWTAEGVPILWSRTSSVDDLGLAEGGGLVFSGYLDGDYGVWVHENSGYVDLRPQIALYAYSPYGSYRLSSIGDGTVSFASLQRYSDDIPPYSSWSVTYGRLQAVPEPASLWVILLPAFSVIRRRRRFR